MSKIVTISIAKYVLLVFSIKHEIKSTKYRFTFDLD